MSGRTVALAGNRKGKSVIVYMITHTATGRAYVGITTQKAHLRWYQHCWDAFNEKRAKGALQYAIKKYGRYAFTFEILREYEDVESAQLAERELIAARNTMRPNGFNLTGGGEMLAGVQISNETRKRMSMIVRGRCNGGCPFPARSSERRSAEMKAHYAEHPKPPESMLTKSRKSEAASAYWKRRRAEYAAGLIERVGHAGHRNSEETKRKLAESVRASWLKRGRSFPDAAKRKVSDGLRAAYDSGRRPSRKGCAPTEEHRAKIAAALRASWARRKAICQMSQGQT